MSTLHSCIRVGAIWLVAMSVAGQPARTQPLPSDPFAHATVNVRAYYDADGLPQNSVESLSIDREGRMWVTTRDGGAVFDGTEWTHVPMPDPETSNWPREVLAASDGTVWFGTEPEGLSRLHRGEWLSWSSSSGLAGRVYSLAEHDGSIVAATSAGIFSLRTDSPAPVREHDGDDVRALGHQGKRLLAVTARGKVLRRDGGKWSDAGFPSTDGATATSILALDGGVLVGTEEGLVHYSTDHEPVRFLEGRSVTSLEESRLPDGSRTLWAGTSGDGLFRFDGEHWAPAAPGIESPNRYVFDIVSVPESGPAVHLVVGTLSGIGRIDLTGWRRIGTSEGLPDASVVSLMQSRSFAPGTYFLGTTRGVAVFDHSGTWHAHPCSELRDASVFAMLESPATDSLYFGTNAGVVQVGRNGCTRLSGLERMSVVSMAETGTTSPTLWAGTYGDGAYFLDASGKWTALRHPLPDPRIEALAVSGPDRDTLWIATNQGLARVSGDSSRLFDQSSGLPHDLVRSLLVRSGEIWAGTARGLARAPLGEDDLEWSVIDLRSDGRLRNDTVYRIEEDQQGRVYVFTGHGVARLRQNPDTGEYVPGRIFLSDDGLPSSETNFGASMVDSSGRLWSGTPRGAGIFDPSLESAEDGMGHNLALSLLVEPQRLKIEDGDVLEFDADRIVASFRLINLAHGHRAVYRTRLDGLDDTPGPWTSSAERTFTKLRGGRYELSVWARDPHGHEAGPATLSFSMQPPPWLSWWAVLAYVAVGVFLLYTLVGLRIRSLRRRNRELELLVRSRTRDLEVANRQLESANITLTDMSVTDPLTGAKNRRFLLQAMEHEAVRVRRSTRESDDIVLILVDIDHFKNLNDRFGHATGDHVLKQFCRVLAMAVRDTDTIVRWGGEEFLIVARKVSRDEAQILVERIIRMVREKRFDSIDGARQLRLTCSIGFATFPFVRWDRNLFTWEQVVDIADHCLYAVKRSGRDGWVGLGPGPRLRADSFLSRMRDDVSAMRAADEVTIITSFPDSGDLVWR
jgi:diguanylate cyclase (GGDEF)-like protein